MEKAQARTLVKRYFDSWLFPNPTQFLSCLHPAGVVRECTGAQYSGREQHSKWFAAWNSGGNRVKSWDLRSFGYDGDSQSAFAEWYFQCTFEGVDYDWLGASVIRFREGMILELNEYERKKSTVEEQESRAENLA